MMASTPALVITPESTADAGAGATGCAVGSQPCIGNMPALVPKPRMTRKVMTSRPVWEAPATGVRPPAVKVTPPR